MEITEIFLNMARLTDLLWLESDRKGRSTGISTLLCILHVGALGNISWTKILIRRDVNTPLACHGQVKVKTLSIDLHSKQVQPLTSGSKVVGLLRSIQFCLLGVEESIEDIRLILFCDANSIIRDMEHDLSMLLLDHEANQSTVGCILYRIPEKALYDILQNEGIDEDEKIILALHLKSNISVTR